MKKIKPPNTIILVFLLLCLFAILTWIIPGGQYERVQIDGAERISPESFTFVDSNPAGIVDVVLAPIRGFTDDFAIKIIVFIFVVAGAFSIIQKTGAFEKVIRRSAWFFSQNPTLRMYFVPVFVVFFSLMGSTFGMSEEVIIFIPLFVPLALAMGYDSITGVAIPFVGAGCGFAGAVLNPFTIGVAQGLAEIPLFSGWELRLFLWISMTIVGIWIIQAHAYKVLRNKESSPVFELDKTRKADEITSEKPTKSLTINDSLILSAFFLTIVALIIGVTRYDWYIMEISGLFLALGIFSALVGRLSGDDTANSILNGMNDVMGAAVIIALSRSILLLITDAQIIDTILYYLSGGLGNLPPIVSAEIMLLVQTVINIVVPSGSGQAALTIPIMAPLGDLVGISRQTIVLIYQLGDGITNLIIPTSGVTMGVLGMARIPWEIWAKWLFPRMLWMYAVAVVFISISILIGY